MPWGGSPPAEKQHPVVLDSKSQSPLISLAPGNTSPGKRMIRKAGGGLGWGAIVRGPLLLLLVVALAVHSIWTFRAGSLQTATCPCSKPQNSTALAPKPQQESLPPMKIEGQKCSTQELERVRNKMHNVVLIVNFNDAETPRKMAAFLRKLYGRFFLAVILIGPQEIPHLQVEARSHNPWRKRWSYSYFHLPAIVARFPEAEGFLWMNSEVVLNYFQLQHADTDKLWLPDVPHCWKRNKPACALGQGKSKDPAPCRCQGYIPFSDGLQATVRDAWSSTKWHKKLVRVSFNNLDNRFQMQHNKSLSPYYGQYQKRTVDIFYVPKRLALKLAFEVMPPFIEAGVWSEVAVPMAFFSLEHPSKYDPILKRVDFKWGANTNQHPEMFWNTSQVAFHYRRQRSKQGKVDLLRVLGRFDPCAKIPLKTLEASLKKELVQSSHGKGSKKQELMQSSRAKVTKKKGRLQK